MAGPVYTVLPRRVSPVMVPLWKVVLIILGFVVACSGLIFALAHAESERLKWQRYAEEDSARVKEVKFPVPLHLLLNDRRLVWIHNGNRLWDITEGRIQRIEVADSFWPREGFICQPLALGE